MQFYSKFCFVLFLSQPGHKFLAENIPSSRTLPVSVTPIPRTTKYHHFWLTVGFKKTIRVTCFPVL